MSHTIERKKFLQPHLDYRYIALSQVGSAGDPEGQGIEATIYLAADQYMEDLGDRSSLMEVRCVVEVRNTAHLGEDLAQCIERLLVGTKDAAESMSAEMGQEREEQ